MAKASTFHVDVSSDDRADFEAALRMLFEGGNRKAVAYRVASEEKNGKPPQVVMMFYWHYDAPVSTELPYPMRVEQAIEFAWGWLEGALYPPQGGGDGSYVRGFRVHSPGSLKCNDSFYAFAAISPEWMYYGK